MPTIPGLPLEAGDLAGIVSLEMQELVHAAHGEIVLRQRIQREPFTLGRDEHETSLFLDDFDAVARRDTVLADVLIQNTRIYIDPCRSINGPQTEQVAFG